MFVYALLSMLALAAPAETDRGLVEIAATKCKNAGSKVDRRLLQALLVLEKKHNVPAYAKGITLAAACRESGYRADPRRGDGGKAVGILQIWPLLVSA